MKYWLFSILTAALAYCFGSLSTLVLASNFSFHTNLKRLGEGNVWLSNFRRVYGVKGILKLALIEIVKDAVPIIIGGWLFSSGDNAVAGRALAAFCLIIGRMYPAIYEFRGGYATAGIVIGAMLISFSLGLAVLVAVVAATLVSRYIAVGSLAGALALGAIAILMIENSVAMRLCIFIALLMFVRTLPALMRIAAKKEPKLSFKEDISYKFDEKF